MSDIGPPLLLSLRIAIFATLLTTLIAIPLALFMARRRFPGKSIVETLILVPLVMPPTVVGYFLLVVFGNQTGLGRWIGRELGIRIIFDIKGAILAAAVVALPMMYIPAKAAFASIERELEEVARLMGANRLQTFWHVTVPLARRGLASGFILAFARAIGEFGATMMVLGWQPGRETLPISIYADYEVDGTSHALPAVIILSVISFALVLAYNFSLGSRSE